MFQLHQPQQQPQQMHGLKLPKLTYFNHNSSSRNKSFNSPVRIFTQPSGWRISSGRIIHQLLRGLLLIQLFYIKTNNFNLFSNATITTNVNLPSSSRSSVSLLCNLPIIQQNAKVSSTCAGRMSRSSQRKRRAIFQVSSIAKNTLQQLTVQETAFSSTSSVLQRFPVTPKPFLISTIRLPRGGGGARNQRGNQDDEDEESNDDDFVAEEDDVDVGFDDDDDFFFNDDNTIGDDDFGVSDADFSEGNIVDRFLDTWNNKTPPFTKFYLSCSVLVTLYGYLCNKNEFPEILLLDWKAILTRGQLWRVVTPFFNFGPAGLGYLMTCQFVYVYMSTLERLNHNRPYDFWIMIAFAQMCMILGYPILKLSPKFLGHNLSTFLVYVWSKYHEGLEVNMFELFNTRAELLPWFFLGQTYLLEGEIPVLDILGIAFGHIYHYCSTVGILRAPQTLQDWYENSTDRFASYIRRLYKPVAADFDAVGA